MCGGETFDEIDVGLLELVEELTRVGGERLDVAPLAFGVEGVEREGRLAGSADAGDHDQLVPRDRDVDVFQVVLAGTGDSDFVGGQGKRKLRVGGGERITWIWAAGGS